MAIRYIYAHDPGAKNYGYCIMSVEHNNIEIIKCGTLEGVLNIKNLTSINNFLYNIIDNVTNTGIQITDLDTIVIERYMSRNVGTSLLETVNIGTGVFLHSLPSTINVHLITPAVWKNWCNKNFNLTELYAKIKVTPHEMDATLMALYILSKEKNSFINDNNIKSIVTDTYFKMLTATKTPLRTRRYKKKAKRK